MPTQRTVLRVQMRPIAGSRFQPTGFPDLGPATFQRPVGETEMQQCVLVESNQSMAQEKVCPTSGQRKVRTVV